MDIKQLLKLEGKQRLWAIGALAGVLLLVIILIVSLVKCSSGSFGDGKSLPVSEALDSLEQRLPKGTGFVVKFPDERRHCLFYLNGGHLYKFDGKTKMLDEVTFSSLTDDAAIYYNDEDLNAGIREAVLSPDKEYIMLTATTTPTDADGKSRQGLYRMNTSNLTIEALAQGNVSREGDLFFVAVIDKVTGAQRALLGFDKSGKQLSREQQQAAIKTYKPAIARTETSESEGGESSGEASGSESGSPAASEGASSTPTATDAPAAAPAAAPAPAPTPAPAPAPAAPASE